MDGGLIMGNVRLYGATSGYTELAPPAVAPDGVLVLPSGTGTIAKTTDQGLVHINTTTFSAVSSVSINDVFNSTYDNYRIVSNIKSTTNTYLNARLRVSGADNTTTNYFVSHVNANSGTVSQFNSSSQNSFTPWALILPDYYAGSFDVYDPNKSVPTLFSGTSWTRWISSPQIVAISGGGIHSANTIFDGISFFLDSGTMTGTIRIFGYKNS